MRIDSATGINSSLTGSFSGSFKGTGDFTGLTADSVAYSNVTGKPTLVSGSAQIDHDATTNFSADEHYTQGNITTVGTVTSGDVSAILPSGTVSGSAQTVANLPSGIVSGSQAAARAQLGLDTGDSPTFTGLTLTGNLEVQGTTTTVDSTTVDIGDNIISVNGTGAVKGGLEVNDVTGGTTTTGSMLWDGTNDYWIAGASGSENEILTTGNVDSDIKTFSLPASTTISAFGATLVDDADAAAARTTLGLGSIATLSSIDISDNTNFAVSDTTGQTGINLTLTDDTVSGVVSGLDTSDDVQFDSFGVGTAASGTTGEIRATGDITAYYSSDERLKENFATLDGALDKVLEMNGYEFDWKEGIEEIVSHKGHDIGVKAQEVQAMYPELVHERDNGYLAVDYIKLTAVLLQAVKELNAKVEELSK